MNKLYICIFGGTTEGRLVAEFLSENNIETDLFIATKYGEQFVKNLNHINIHRKRINEKEMIELFQEKKYDFVVDATHPFAEIVSENILNSTNACNLKSIRVMREPLNNENCNYFDTVEQCVKYLNEKEGNILLTTGSKDLNKFAKVKNYNEIIHVRILPMEDSLKRCIDLGYLNKNIICMQGPFSEELNTAMIKHTKAKYVVTKESAKSGGFQQKVDACIASGAECLVIRKPYEEGITIEDIRKFINKIINERK